MAAITLAIETSSAPTSVCLLKGSDLLEEYLIDTPQQTSTLLSKHIQSLISSHLTSAQEIDKVAVSIGPGSFTGLRAGVAAAKGLVFAIKKPLVAVDTLEAIYKAYLAKCENKYDYYIPLIDARKGKAFSTVFDKNGNRLEENKLTYLKNNNLIGWQANSILLPLNRKFDEFFLQSSFDCKAIPLTSLHIGLAANEYNEVFDEHKIAYLEPNYIVNNYVK